MKNNILFGFIMIMLISCTTAINNSVSPSPSSQATMSSTPSLGPTGGTGDYFIGAPITGYIYDENKKLLTFGKVKMEFLEIPADILVKPTYSSREEDFDNEGRYRITNLPIGSKVKITASKEGYNSISRIEILKQPAESNIFNFGGDGEDAKYALTKITS